MLPAAPAPSIPSHSMLIFLLQVAVLLLVALALGRLATRFGLPALVGELATGLLLGPSILGAALPGVERWLFPSTASQANLLDSVVQFSVVLLVGITGAQVDIRALRERSAATASIAGAALVLPLVLGCATGYLLAHLLAPSHVNPAVFAGFLGVAMSVSALPVIAKTLADMNLTHRNVGQLILSAGVVDDAIAWCLLSIVSAWATIGLSWQHITLSLVYPIGFVLVAFVIGRPLCDFVLGLACRSSDSAPTIAATVVLVVLGGAASQALGLEAIFGAFVVGVLIGRSPKLVPQRLAPLRTMVFAVLAPLFLASAGLRMNLDSLLDPTTALLALAILAIAVVSKFTGAYAGSRAARLNHWEAVAIGAGLNARGMVEVVVATTGLSLGILDTRSFTIILLVAIATSVMAPPLLKWAAAHLNIDDGELARQEVHNAWLGVPVPATSAHKDVC